MSTRSPSSSVAPVAGALALSKRRARRRAREGGAVVFIVSMTIGVLVSLGAFALISASTEIKSAGYERQALQTHYLAEYGMVAAAQKIGSDYAMAVESSMRTPGLFSANSVGDYDPSFPRNHCISLEQVPATASASSRACKILRMPDLSQNWAIATPLRASSITTPGSLGGVALDGTFGVEVTDASFGAPVAGMANLGQQLMTMCPVTFTVTTFGQILPNNAAGNIPQTYGGASLEEGRARLTGGPIPCPQ